MKLGLWIKVLSFIDGLTQKRLKYMNNIFTQEILLDNYLANHTNLKL